MPFQPVPFGAQMLLRFTSADGSRFLGANIWNFRALNSPISAGALNDLAIAIATAWETDFAPLVPEGVALASIEGRSLETEEAPYDLLVVGVPGEVVTPVLPANVTLAVSMRTGTTGRSRRGRFYWIQLGESQVGGNTVNSGLLTSIREACEAMAVATNGADFDWSILSRTTNGEPREEGALFPITAWGFTDAFVDTQRRRVLRGNP